MNIALYAVGCKLNKTKWGIVYLQAGEGMVLKLIKQKESIVRNLLTLIFLTVFTIQAFAYSGGPPDERANNPPNYLNCTQCHNSFALNSGAGTLELTGLPAEGFEPDQTYDLTLTLTDPGQVRWGIEIAVQYESGGSYLQAGTMIVTDPTHTQLSTAGGVQFLKQTSAGTYPSTSGPTSWDFQWTAPDASVDMLTFYYVGNGANGGGSSGDYIYAETSELSQYVAPQPPVVSDIPDQTITQGESFTPIILDDYVNDPDTPDDQITWEASITSEITVAIVDRIATITPPTPDWTGFATIGFTATDPTNLSDSDDATFTVLEAGVIPRPESGIPGEFTLNQNYPNPFNAETTISFALPKESLVNLSLFSIDGRLVKQLHQGSLSAGVYDLTVNLQDYASGIYLYSLTTEEFSSVKRMLLVK